MKKLSKIASLILSKTVLSALVIWLWSASCSAYDFSVTCYGDNGLCGPGVNFTLTKISTAHDAVAIPFSPVSVQIYLANCSSDTSCTKLVGPFWEKAINYPAWEAKTWGNLGTKFLTANILNGAITAGINAGSGDVWNPQAYKNLCFSITPVNPSNGWSIWGINYTYPAGTVMCSVPINRVVADTCSVSTPSIDVAFGQLERSEISTTLPASNDVSKTLTLNCSGTSVHNFSLKLNMTPVSWSNSQITTSNSALGISVSKDSTVLNNGSSFDMSVAGSGTAGLVFSVLRNPSLPSSSIATGDFTASATLVVTEQ
ncbi:fimbrial protein [Pantoea sp. USHLN298]|jgi:minor fimbrial subunit|uniref:fimbrial protein n=1 Tax=Pantoea sp. USHLN298 TaxID=3081294 RepID=UPI0030178BB8